MIKEYSCIGGVELNLVVMEEYSSFGSSRV